jgi:glycosyltransferase involved in cell wall biosynthesis
MAAPRSLKAMKSALARRVREALLHAERLMTPAGRPRVVIFLSDSQTGFPGDLRGVRIARHLRRLGWRAFAVHPGLDLDQRRRLLLAERPDVVLLQQSRHPLNRPRLYEEYPCVFDADDADFLDPRCTDAVVECVSESRAAIAGSRFLANEFRKYNPNVRVVWTGTYVQSVPKRPVNNEEAVPTVAWAHSGPLGYPDEARLVREIVLELVKSTRFTFRLYGVQDQDPPVRQAIHEYLAPIRAAGIKVETFRPMPYRAFIESLSGASVGLHPVCLENEYSQGKSFGKLLAYLAADVPIVTTDAVDHGLFFRDRVNGILVSNDVSEWADSCHQLLTDPELSARLVARARRDFLRRLTTERASELVDQTLRSVVAETAPKV